MFIVMNVMKHLRLVNLEKNNERCPVCGVKSSEILSWKQSRYWNNSLLRYPKKGVKYSLFGYNV